MSRLFDRLDRAAKRAYDRTNQVFGFNTDPQLAVYNKLTTQDFDAIRAEYGDEGLSQYVQAMEARRLKGRS